MTTTWEFVGILRQTLTYFGLEGALSDVQLLAMCSTTKVP